MIQRMELVYPNLDGLSYVDSVLDGDIFDIFSEDTDDSELLLAQQAYDIFRAPVVKQNSFQMAPKVMKNDIRRYFARMFMNTLNSGDFGKLQDYFHTFMPTCSKFVIDHYQVNDRFNIPNMLESHGPKLMAHYLLGTNVMFPDMVVLMKGSRITTSNAWKGTKVEMEVDVLATKMYDLSIDDWLPQIANLDNRCRKLFEEKSRQAGSKKSSPPADSAMIKKERVVDPTLIKTETDVSHIVSEEGRHISSNDQLTDTHITAGSSKRKVSDLDTTDTDSDTLSTHETARERALLQPHIPEEYVHALCARATLLPEPVQLHMQGTILMFLDENNHIQHMNMTMIEK